MTKQAFHWLCRQCEVEDETVTKKALEDIFQKCYIGEGHVWTGSEKGALNDRPLRRFEFLRAVVLLAWLKSGSDHGGDGNFKQQLPDSCEKLIVEHLNKHGPAAGRVDSDGFRQRRLYNQHTHHVLTLHQDTLQAVCCSLKHVSRAQPSFLDALTGNMSTAVFSGPSHRLMPKLLLQIFTAYADEEPKDAVLNHVAAANYAAQPTGIVPNSDTNGSNLAFLSFPEVPPPPTSQPASHEIYSARTSGCRCDVGQQADDSQRLD